MAPQAPRPTTPLHLRWMLAFYALLGLAAAVWASLSRGPSLWTPHPPAIECLDELHPCLLHGAAAGLGALLGLALVALSAWATGRWLWARKLESALADMLGPLRGKDILALAGASSLVEEALFRGLLQPAIGWLGASLAFGLLHIGPDKRFRAWTLLALGTGMLLGGLTLLSGSLWAPICCHAVVNACNLRRITSQGATP